MKYLIKGKLYEPIKVGDEGDWCQEPCSTCHDCGRGKGEYHMECCDIERCPCCGGQLISCDCGPIYNVDGDVSEEELEELCKVQVTQTIANSLEIDCYINKRELAYDSDGEDGNIFFYLAKAKEILEGQGKDDEFEKLKEKVYSVNSYDEAIKKIIDTLQLSNIKQNNEIKM